MGCSPESARCNLNVVCRCMSLWSRELPLTMPRPLLRYVICITAVPCDLEILLDSACSRLQWRWSSYARCHLAKCTIIMHIEELLHQNDSIMPKSMHDAVILLQSSPICMHDNLLAEGY